MASTTPLHLKKVILDFHSLGEVGKNGTYEATLLIPADHPDYEKVKKFYGDSLKRYRELSKAPKAKWKYSPIETGAAKNEVREEAGKSPYEHWGDDTLILKGKSKFPVTLLNHVKSKAEGSLFTRGCLVNVVLNVTETDKITIQTDSGPESMILCLTFLAGVMWAGHGTKIASGGGEADFSAFEEISDDEIGTPSDSEDDDDLPF